MGVWGSSGLHGRKLKVSPSYSPSITSVELLDVLSGPHRGLFASPRFHLIQGDYGQVNKMAYAKVYADFRKQLDFVLADKKMTSDQRGKALQKLIEQFGNTLNNLANIHSKPNVRGPKNPDVLELKPGGKIGKKYLPSNTLEKPLESRSKL